MTEPCFAAEPLGWLPFITILAHKPSEKKCNDWVKLQQKLPNVITWCAITMS